MKYRGAKNILEGDLQNHRLKPQDINAVVPELYARDPWSIGGIYRGIKHRVQRVIKTAGQVVQTVRKVMGTANQVAGTLRQVAGTAGKMSAQFPNLSVGLF